MDKVAITMFNIQFPPLQHKKGHHLTFFLVIYAVAHHTRGERLSNIFLLVYYDTCFPKNNNPHKLIPNIFSEKYSTCHTSLPCLQSTRMSIGQSGMNGMDSYGLNSDLQHYFLKPRLLLVPLVLRRDTRLALLYQPGNPPAKKTSMSPSESTLKPPNYIA